VPGRFRRFCPRTATRDCSGSPASKCCVATMPTAGPPAYGLEKGSEGLYEGSTWEAGTFDFSCCACGGRACSRLLATAATQRLGATSSTAPCERLLGRAQRGGIGDQVARTTSRPRWRLAASEGGSSFPIATRRRAGTSRVAGRAVRSFPDPAEFEAMIAGLPIARPLRYRAQRDGRCRR